MKNIHLLPTDKPSILFLNNVNKKLLIDNNGTLKNVLPSGLYHNIYIISNDKIEDGNWFLTNDKRIEKNASDWNAREWHKKIILTTDQDLIADGVQAIDDEFLEWFVKNPTCEKIDLDTFSMGNKILYNVVYLKEKPKQETLEQAAKQYKDLKLPDDLYDAFIAGAKWQAERMYSEEEVGEILYNAFGEYGKHYGIMIDGALINKLFEQFREDYYNLKKVKSC